MAFLKDKKRKIVPPSFINTDTVINISLQDKSITDGHGTANFERLLYKNCPVLPIAGKRTLIPIDQPDFIYADRQLLVVRICNAIHGLDATVRTKVNIFNETVRFLKMTDEQNIKNIFCIDTISMYIKSLVSLYHQGNKGKTLSGRQNSIKALLKSMDHELYKQCESMFFSFPDDTQSVTPYTDDEVKELFSALQIIYNCYSTHVENNTKPKAFPLYELKNAQGNYRYINKTSSERTVSYNNSDTVWITDLVRAAYFMTCFYTGANSSSLLKLKLSDFTGEIFKNLNRKTYKLSTKKGRQSGRTNEIDVGFTKEARSFFESWINVSKKINNDANCFLFPNPSINNKSPMTDSGMSVLNKTFVDLGLPALSSQRFRKTKASLIMRATESVFFVSQGLNNSVETVAKLNRHG